MAGISSDSVITRQFTSANQAVTAASLVTVAHGFGVVPKFMTFELVCVTADNGWSVNDVITVHSGGTSSANGFMAYADATNINVRFSTNSISVNVCNKTTGAAGTVTLANWNLRIKAFV